MTKVIVRLYDDFSKAREAIEDLVKAGFSDETISLIARDVEGQFAAHVQKQAPPAEQGPADSEEEGAVTGGLIGGLAGMLLGLGMVAIPGVGPVLAAGPLATALVGAGAGIVTGSLVGAIAEWDVSEAEAEYYAEQVRHGSTLVCVLTADDNEANRAATILNRLDPIKVE